MTDRFTERIAEAYGSYSREYASILEPILQPMAEQIVTLGRLKGDERVLDLAAGTGLIARTAASHVRIALGVDISWGALQQAQRLGAGRIPWVTGDAHRLPFKDGTFDLITCGVSLSHFSRIQTALEEVYRALRPGGQLITSAWGSGGSNPAKAAAVEVRKKYLEDRELIYQGNFSEDLWADPERGGETLRQAGFARVQVTTQLLSGEYVSHAQAVEAALAWPLTRYRIAQLDPSDQERLEAETADAIKEVSDLRWQSEVHFYLASHPAETARRVADPRK
jgi:ubiquinone/menaquinone biosynthesis C-methylase UbiE